MSSYESLKAAALSATPGPWKCVAVPVLGDLGATFEIAQIVNGTEGQATALYMLNANGLCPALTGTGPNAANNARYLELCPPETVIALLAALEEKDQRIAELEQQASNDCYNITGLLSQCEMWQQKHETAERRLATQNRHVCELFDEAKMLRERNAELEQRLQQPIKLPPLSGDGENDTDYTEGLNDGISQSAIYLRRQGFKVEGE